MIASIEDRAHPEMDRCHIVRRHPGAVFGRISFERQVEMGKMLVAGVSRRHIAEITGISPLTISRRAKKIGLLLRSPKRAQQQCFRGHPMRITRAGYKYCPACNRLRNAKYCQKRQLSNVGSGR
jgi:hypothetical protein